MHGRKRIREDGGTKPISDFNEGGGGGEGSILPCCGTLTLTISAMRHLIPESIERGAYRASLSTSSAIRRSLYCIRVTGPLLYMRHRPSTVYASQAFYCICVTGPLLYMRRSHRIFLKTCIACSICICMCMCSNTMT
jgi:hypothetical protein